MVSDHFHGHDPYTKLERNWPAFFETGEAGETELLLNDKWADPLLDLSEAFGSAIRMVGIERLLEMAQKFAPAGVLSEFLNVVGDAAMAVVALKFTLHAIRWALRNGVDIVRFDFQTGWAAGGRLYTKQVPGQGHVLITGT